MAPLARSWAWLRHHALPIYAALAVAYMLIPIAVIALFSFGKTPKGKLTFTFDSFTTEYWRHAFSITELNDAMIISLKLAALATVISTVIGTLMAMALVRYEFFARRTTNLLFILPMASPEVVIGAALLSFFIILTAPLGFTTLLIAHVMFCISFVVVVVRSRLIGFDRSLEEAARDLGATPVQTFRYVTFPLYVYGVALRGIPVQVNVLATILFGVTTLAVVLVIWQQRRAEQMAAVQPEPKSQGLPQPA